MSLGKEIMAGSVCDCKGLEARLTSVEEDWNQLESSISTVEQQLFQMWMEQLPSQQMLDELQLWLEEMEKTLEADAKKPIKALSSVQTILIKYQVSLGVSSWACSFLQLFSDLVLGL